MQNFVHRVVTSLIFQAVAFIVILLATSSLAIAANANLSGYMAAIFISGTLTFTLFRYINRPIS